MRLNLKRRWPWLVTAWLPRTDGKGRARGELDLAWCHVCLAEGRRVFALLCAEMAPARAARMAAAITGAPRKQLYQTTAD